MEKFNRFLPRDCLKGESSLSGPADVNIDIWRPGVGSGISISFLLKLLSQYSNPKRPLSYGLRTKKYRLLINKSSWQTQNGPHPSRLESSPIYRVFCKVVSTFCISIKANKCVIFFHDNTIHTQFFLVTSTIFRETDYISPFAMYTTPSRSMNTEIEERRQCATVYNTLILQKLFVASRAKFRDFCQRYFIKHKALCFGLITFILH